MDWIGDTLSRIRNALMVGKRNVTVRGTKIVVNILNIMKDEGFIESFEFSEDKKGFKQACVVKLAYRDSNSVIRGLERISRPGLRKYAKSEDLKIYLRRFSVPIISTSKFGILSGKYAVNKNIGGELICEVF